MALRKTREWQHWTPLSLRGGAAELRGSAAAAERERRPRERSAASVGPLRRGGPTPRQLGPRNAARADGRPNRPQRGFLDPSCCRERGLASLGGVGEGLVAFLKNIPRKSWDAMVDRRLADERPPAGDAISMSVPVYPRTPCARGTPRGAGVPVVKRSRS